MVLIGGELRLLRRFRSKVSADGVFGLLRSVKVNFFWFFEKTILTYALFLLPLAFRKPRFLYLELTNACNLRCRMCFRGGREEGFMPFDLFKQLVDEAAKIGGVSLSFHFAGEATLHPRFVDCINYAVSKKGCFYKLGLTTNGTAFNREVALACLSLDWVTFSLDGVGAVGERIRRGLDYSSVKENIEEFLRLRGSKLKPLISTNTVISGQSNEELAEMICQWQPKGVFVNFSGCISDRFKLLIQPRYSLFARRWLNEHETKRCRFPFTHLLVRWDGKVHFCCHNLHGLFPVGDVHEQSLMEIWRGSKMREVRRAILKKKPLQNTVCSLCEKYSFEGNN